uniref:Uncharacterized protein n=1 Tax=Caenorhabditis japonica TaxID=281687 RepID=A0A8R1ILH8_CAEJA
MYSTWAIACTASLPLIGTMLIDCCSEAVITVFDEIHSRHPWFLIYTVPESTRATLDTLAKVLQAGFSIDATSWSLSKIVSHIKSSLRNYIYKRRSKQGYIQEMLEEFKILLKSTEQSVEPEEPVVIPENDISIEKTVDVVAHEDTFYYTWYKTLITRSNRTKNFACIWTVPASRKTQYSTLNRIQDST